MKEFEITYTQYDIQQEKNVFLTKTFSGRLIVLALLLFLIVLLFFVFLHIDDYAHGDLFAYLFIATKSIVLACCLLFFGYFWLNAGGPVSFHFTSEEKRVFRLTDERLEVEEGGSSASFRFADLKIIERGISSFLIANDKVYKLKSSAKGGELKELINQRCGESR